jgi:rhodanese-related sulfurtransferase
MAMNQSLREQADPGLRLHFIFAVAFLVILFPSVTSTFAQNGESATAEAEWLKSAHRNSGVSCIQRAAEMLNAPVNMINLLTSPHARAAESRIDEAIVAMTNEQGLHALALQDMTLRQLGRCPYPVILHVKGARFSTTPDYFVLFSGMKEGQCKIINDTREVIIPPDHLMEQWTGKAIIVSREPISSDVAFLSNSQFSSRYLLMGGSAFAVLGIALFSHSRSRPSVGKSFFQAGGIIAVSVALALSSQLIAGDSLWPGVISTPRVQDGHAYDFIRHQSVADSKAASKSPRQISLADALRLFEDGNTLFVDARDPSEYLSGHIKGAISYPASDVDRQQHLLKNIEKNRPIVVYCAVASCSKGDYVASFLMAHHFSDVVVFTGGYTKWTGPKQK